MDTQFMETDCKITHEGREFDSGGAYILPCTDGKWRGVVYVKINNDSPTWRGVYRGTVTTWKGEKIADCSATYFDGNFCRMSAVSFDWNGHHFTGRYCPDWADACKVHSTH